MVTQPRAFALHLPWGVIPVGSSAHGDDGGGDITNIVITSSLHLIKILNELQPYAYASPASPPFDI